MDTFELRNHYAELTGDVENAFKSNESDQEGFFYSDETIRRAIDSIENANRLSDRPMITEAIGQYGPRAGVGIGQMGAMFNPQSAYSNVTNDLDDAKRAYGQRDFGSMFKSLGDAGMQGMSVNRLRREGAARGLFEFLKSLM
tara:strand:- start:512 stop:937 length:426 start_codon:yes stop_codon:yes gene_type:complete